MNKTPLFLVAALLLASVAHSLPAPRDAVTFAPIPSWLNSAPAITRSASSLARDPCDDAFLNPQQSEKIIKKADSLVWSFLLDAWRIILSDKGSVKDAIQMASAKLALVETHIKKAQEINDRQPPSRETSRVALQIRGHLAALAGQRFILDKLPYLAVLPKFILNSIGLGEAGLDKLVAQAGTEINKGISAPESGSGESDGIITGEMRKVVRLIEEHKQKTLKDLEVLENEAEGDATVDGVVVKCFGRMPVGEVEA